MLTNTAVYQTEDGSLLLAPHRAFTVDEYHQMAEVGIFSEDENVELLAGDIFTKSPGGLRHRAAVMRLNAVLLQHLQGKAIVAVKSAIRLDEVSEPQPDIALLKYRKDFYARQMPTAVDVYLLIEVADSTMPFDRRVKRSLYARALIPEYWIINLIDNQVEIYRQPKDGRYAQKSVVNVDGMVTAVAFPDTPFPVTDLIG